jgi:hypothetical protein
MIKLQVPFQNFALLLPSQFVENFAEIFPKLPAEYFTSIFRYPYLGYSSGTVANHRNTWKEFQRFAQDREGTEALSMDMVHQFLASYGISSAEAEAGLTFRQRHVRTVMRVLSEFALHGCFQLCGRRRKEEKLTTEMGNILCAYEGFCREHLKSHTGTVRIRKRNICLVPSLSRLPWYKARVKEIQRDRCSPDSCPGVLI